ncbi:MAG: NADH-quinone oxidoreductase subunit M [Deltaproteobacteria bacterium]|nr:NADH-quinone oxidoreductase subunit M [Deltaproteobacteria bacterium]
MILGWIVVLTLAGGALAWSGGRRASRWIALGTLALDLVLVGPLFLRRPATPAGRRWLAELVLPWMPRYGVGIHLAIDGLSLLLIVLTLVLGILAVVASWREITQRTGFFHFNLMAVLAGILGVFMALDLFLFYLFWELMLLPMALLIAIWGHERRTRAAIKFFLFTQAGGLVMLVSILGLAFVHHADTGVLTFDYPELVGTPMPAAVEMLLMLGFFLGFAVKLPAVPLHTWLPDAHTEAPTAGSVVLAGLLLKTGAYGLLRFALPIFPEASRAFAPVAMTLGTIGIVYGAVLAWAQTDLKRLVAYTSVSHLGFVLLGIYAAGTVAQEGAVVQMLAHGLSTGGLFILVGALQERLGTRSLDRMGGLWAMAPRMGVLGMMLALASLGLPAFGNFVGEILVLVGSYPRSPELTAVATAAMVLATAYSLRLVQRTFFGARAEPASVLQDLSARETAVLVAAALGLICLGLYPQPVLDTAEPALGALRTVFGQVARR